MKTKMEIGFIPIEEVKPLKGDLCSQCIALGLNFCEEDEICLPRLARALGKEIKEVYPSILEAKKKGLIAIRTVNSQPGKFIFIKITDEGKLFFESGIKK